MGVKLGEDGRICRASVVYGEYGFPDEPPTEEDMGMRLSKFRGYERPCYVTGIGCAYILIGGT